MRIDKYLADCGVGSRSEIKKIIKEGRVRIQDTVIKDAGYAVEPSASVFLDGAPVVYRKFVYLMMNKPQGVVSATDDNVHPTVLSLLPKEYDHFDLFPCGRLDIDTEGFLLITNDGQTAHKLLSPRHKKPKTYYAKVEGAIPDSAVKQFHDGMDMGEYQTMPAELCILSVGEVSEAEVTIFEGKFHQVKKMFEKVGTPVIYLKRLSFAGLSLDPTLSPGSFRELTLQETAVLCNLYK